MYLNNDAIIRRRLISIDSRFRVDTTNQTTSDFTYRLSTALRNIMSVRLASIEIPNTNYVFTNDKGNTSFQISNDMLTSPTTIDISEGNYTASDFISEVQSKLSNHTISLDPKTGKTTISRNNGDPFKIEFPNYSNNRYDNGIGYFLGFRKFIYEDASSYTSEGIVDVIGDQYFFLQITGLESLEHQFSDSTIFKAFAKIIVRQDKMAMVFDDGSNFLTKEVVFNQPTTIWNFRVRVVDGFGRVVNLNDMNMSLTVEVREVMNTNVAENLRTQMLEL